MLDETQLKTSQLEIPTSEEDMCLLEQAATITNQSIPEFLLEEGLKAAASTLLDQNVIRLNDEQWKLFCEMLDGPAQDNPGLKRLLSTPSVLER